MLKCESTVCTVFLYMCKSVWQWEGDDGQWEPYSPSACTLLNSAVASGTSSVHLSLDSGQSYEVDLKKMLQINPVTKYKRKIRCQTVKPGTYILESVNDIWTQLKTCVL